MRREQTLETAAQETPERARQFARGQRQQIDPFLDQEIRMVKAGAYPCIKCGRTERVPVGDPRHLRPMCADCARNSKLDREVARQQSQHAGTRRA